MPVGSTIRNIAVALPIGTELLPTGYLPVIFDSFACRVSDV